MLPKTKQNNQLRSIKLYSPCTKETAVLCAISIMYTVMRKDSNKCNMYESHSGEHHLYRNQLNLGNNHNNSTCYVILHVGTFVMYIDETCLLPLENCISLR